MKKWYAVTYIYSHIQSKTVNTKAVVVSSWEVTFKWMNECIVFLFCACMYVFLQNVTQQKPFKYFPNIDLSDSISLNTSLSPLFVYFFPSFFSIYVWIWFGEVWCSYDCHHLSDVNAFVPLHKYSFVLVNKLYAEHINEYQIYPESPTILMHYAWCSNRYGCINMHFNGKRQ